MRGVFGWLYRVRWFRWLVFELFWQSEVEDLWQRNLQIYYCWLRCHEEGVSGKFRKNTMSKRERNWNNFVVLVIGHHLEKLKLRNLKF